MALDPAKAASLFQVVVEEQIQRVEQGDPIAPPEEVAEGLADAYFEYSKGATLPGADMTSGGTRQILVDAFTFSEAEAMPLQLSNGIATYWSSFNTPGLPAHGGSAVVSVVVNGIPLATAFETAIRGSINDQLIPEPYEVFFQNIELVVNTIPCVITELVNGTPTPFPETIT